MDMIELAVVSVVSGLIILFMVILLHTAPQVYDMRDFPEQDIGVMNE